MKVFLDSVGCRLNQAEIEQLADALRAAGHELVGSPDQGDWMVLNTCTVTAAAGAESRTRVRKAWRANQKLDIALTGCWSTLEPDAAAALPGVQHVIPNQDKDTLLLPLLDQDATPSHDLEPLARRPVPGLRMRTRAFIKVQDGCDHHCTFCLTTLARGPARSIPLKTVLQRIDQAQAGGAQEIVLSGVSLSAYGKDLGPGMTLSTLIEAILKNSNIPRLRLSSIEPWGLPAGFFALWQDPRLCRQLHLPLQSGCAATLRRMARPIRPREYAQLVAQARSAIPDLALSTDLIVGFPGESEAEFSQNLAFVQEIGFSDAHIFRFSLRPGTAATRLPGRVPGDIARNRAQRLSEVIDQSKAAYHRRFLGREVEVLWESAAVLGPDGWQIQGLSNHSLRVHTIADQSHWNRLSMVRIETRRDDGDLQGQLISKC